MGHGCDEAARQHLEEALLCCELALHSVGTMSDVCSLRTPVFPPACN